MAASRESLLAGLQECQRNLDSLRAQNTSRSKSLEEVEGSIRTLQAKTVRKEREEVRLDSAYEARKTLAATVEGLRVAIERREAEEYDLKRTLQALQPGLNLLHVCVWCTRLRPAPQFVGVRK